MYRMTNAEVEQVALEHATWEAGVQHALQQGFNALVAYGRWAQTALPEQFEHEENEKVRAVIKEILWWGNVSVACQQEMTKIVERVKGWTREGRGTKMGLQNLDRVERQAAVLQVTMSPERRAEIEAMLALNFTRGRANE